MKSLDPDWFIQHLVDAEYQKYVLLTYLQQVQRSFTAVKLYPHLAELAAHYHHLHDFAERRQQLRNEFPAEIDGIEQDRFQWRYREKVEDDALMKEISHILEYSLPLIRHHLAEGRGIYSQVSSTMQISPIGIIPIYKHEGYLLLKDGLKADTVVYRYQLTLYAGQYDRYRKVNTFFIDRYRRSLINTAENIKKDLVKQFRTLPNPATYYIESLLSYPLHETFLPLLQNIYLLNILSPPLNFEQ